MKDRYQDQLEALRMRWQSLGIPDDLACYVDRRARDLGETTVRPATEWLEALRVDWERFCFPEGPGE